MNSISQNMSFVGCPWLVAGDMNMTPDECVSTNWSILNGGIIHTADVDKTTTQRDGRLVDYAVMSQSMHSLVASTEIVYDGPFRPHVGILYTINARPRKVMIPKFWKPKELPSIGDRIEPMDFQECMRQAKKYNMIKKPPGLVEEYKNTFPDRNPADSLFVIFVPRSAPGLMCGALFE